MNLLLGALSTLAVTASVQIFVIPWVQRRNRHRERWEKDVISLETLLRDELPQALTKLEWASQGLREAHSAKGVDGNPPDRVPYVHATTEAEARIANDAVEALIIRLRLLQARVQLVNRDSPYWVGVNGHTHALIVAMLTADPGPWNEADIATMGNLEFDTLWAELGARRAELIETLEQISDAMKPPPRFLIRRAHQRTGERILTVRERLLRRLPAELTGLRPSEGIANDQD
jgi:hypothetical protein